MSYDSSSLVPPRPDSATWALNMVRFYLRDTAAPFAYQDDEIAAFVALEAFTASDDTVWYRPHMAAANMIDADADRAINESLLSASVGYRTPDQIARAIRKSGRKIDALIEAETHESPPRTTNLTPVF